MTVHAQPGQEGAKVEFKARYANWIGGEWVPPTKGQYFENFTPITGKQFPEAARGTEDIELALDAAPKAAPGAGKASAADRALILNRATDRITDNLEMRAVAETWDSDKPIRETLAADVPLAADHLRHFAGAIPAQDGSLSQIDPYLAPPAFGGFKSSGIGRGTHLMVLGHYQQTKNLLVSCSEGKLGTFKDRGAPPAPHDTTQ